MGSAHTSEKQERNDGDAEKLALTVSARAPVRRDYGTLYFDHEDYGMNSGVSAENAESADWVGCGSSEAMPSA